VAARIQLPRPRHLVGALLAAVVVAELAARAAGLHTPVLYERTQYGYRAVPNQTLRRFGNAVRYNAEGLRSEPMTEPMPPSEVRVLCVGDSITNGGTPIDQADTYPYLLEAQLARSTRGVRVLNASAGGWALENELGWLRANGDFGSRVVVLEVGTHDLFQSRAPSETVGTHPSFPDRPPPFALAELVQRYLLPRIGLSAAAAQDPGAAGVARTEADLQHALDALAALIAEARRLGAQPIVMLVEQPSGLEPSDSLTIEAKRRMRTCCARSTCASSFPRRRLICFATACIPTPRATALSRRRSRLR
jgi:hypothetical protein